jgi:hypothetical protein
MMLDEIEEFSLWMSLIAFVFSILFAGLRSLVIAAERKYLSRRPSAGAHTLATAEL